MRMRPRPDLVRRYLAELGAEPEPPSRGALRRLHAAHAARFAHDTFWVARGRIPPPEPEAFVEGLLAGEGGGCAQLNGGFAWLLDQLGYEGTLHRAALRDVWADPGAPPTWEHLVVHVHFDGPGGSPAEYVDVGLGNALSESIPLAAGTYRQGPFTFGLQAPDGDRPDWVFLPDRRVRSLREVVCAAVPVTVEELVADDLGDVLAPGSPLAEHLWAQHRRPEAIEVLWARTLARFDSEGRSVRLVDDRDEWAGILRDTFRLGLPGLTEAELDALWARAGG